MERENTFLISSVPNKLLNILESIAETAMVLLVTESTLNTEVPNLVLQKVVRVVETVNLRSV
jgi:hypothetical protein